MPSPDFLATSRRCPLCCNKKIEAYWRDRKRDYYRCNTCHLVFVPSSFWLSPKEEKAQYDLHENSPDDAAYREFLGRLFNPLEPRLSRQSRGLDFGCGPGPALSIMFEEQGHRVAIYDKFYASDRSVLAQTYDFVTATEVVEHLAEPGMELDRLWAMVKPGGWLGLMTKMVTGIRAFSCWHYKNDPTHICFFSRQTFGMLGGKWNAQPEFAGSDVVIFRKTDRGWREEQGRGEPRPCDQLITPQSPSRLQQHP